MPRGRLLARTGEFSVADVACDDPARGWSAAEEETGHALVVIRQGLLVRRAHGADVLVDGSNGYLGEPGTVEEFAHPAGADRCTSIRLSAGLLSGLAGGDPRLSLDSVPMDPAAHLAAWRVTRLAAGGDPDGSLAERVIRLAATLISRRLPGRVASGTPPRAARKRLADSARAALHADPSLTLTGLASLAGCSPHHLSRVFAEVNEATVTAYRNQLRVRMALARLAGGERDLAGLAAFLGFADHAHLTRTIRAHTGSTPSRIRELLAGPLTRRPC